MPPQEKSPLLGSKEQHDRYSVHAPHSLTSFVDLPNCTRSSTKNPFRLAFQKYFKSILATTLVAVFTVTLYFSIHVKSRGKATGAYRVVEIQQGSHFTDSYTFYNGADSIGSAGYNTYVSQQRALDLGLIRITDDQDVFIQSSPTIQGPRESIRLEGKRRYNRGLFVIDLNHMPAGCGVWPAVWLTDEANWPDHGEIDIVEGVNTLKTAKTALHTSESCSMYAHVPDDSRTGHWDSATGIPDTFTGSLDNFTRVRADNCWVMAPHQWANQGCVAVHDKQGTIGTPFNQQGGGVYVLEWDPVAGYIKSWVFSPHEAMPENLQKAMNTASDDNPAVPEPTLWGAPYALFAIGDNSGCSVDHFQNMRLIFNLAFCGSVAGNRFEMDCPEENKWAGQRNPVDACNAYIKSEPDALDEAYWKIRGVFIYERELE